MICPRHNAVATHEDAGVPYCLRCFGEAIRGERQMTPKQVRRRLDGRPAYDANRIGIKRV